MRAFLPISLVVLLLLNLFGFYLAYYIKLEGVHEEMEEALGSSQSTLQLITLNNAEYKQVEWTTPGKECRINGNMYDVAKTEVVADGVRLYVRVDEDETSLDNNFAKNFQSKQDLPGTPLKLLANLLGQDFVVAKNKIVLAAPASPAILSQPASTSPLAEFIMEKISPPPWC